MIFTIFDVVLLGIITISTIFGVYRGLINIIIGFIGFAASIVVAVLAYPYIDSFLAVYIENKILASIISATVAYVGSLIIFTLLTSKVILLFSNSSCGFTDRFFGLIAGFIRGYLLSLIIFIVTVIFISGSYIKADNAAELISESIDCQEYPQWLQKSETTIYMKDGLKTIIGLLPEDFLKSIKIPGKNKDKSEIDLDEESVEKIEKSSD